MPELKDRLLGQLACNCSCSYYPVRISSSLSLKVLSYSFRARAPLMNIIWFYEQILAGCMMIVQTRLSKKGSQHTKNICKYGKKENLVLRAAKEIDHH